MIPRATYRLQLHRDFTFDDAVRIVPYLSSLGISHLYLSPLLKARAGSRHGYDIVDHSQLNPELGGEDAYKRLCDALARHAMSQVIDIVPNHMGVLGSDNPAWLNLIEWGQQSPYAHWFDIDWRTSPHQKILVPILDAQPGQALRNGDLKIRFDRTEGSFAFWAYDTHKLPIAPTSYEALLPHLDALTGPLAERFAALRPSSCTRLEAAELKLALADLPKAAHDAIDQHLRSFCPNERAIPEKLADLLAQQNWRVAHFRVAGDDINYRRFFNINELAGIRIESDEVFHETHAEIIRLIERGDVTGLRIDHIDGLRAPSGYLERLREIAGPGFFIVVEKILASHEQLPSKWPVQGTTGYEFAAALARFMIDPGGLQTLNQTHAEFTGLTDSFSDIAFQAKLEMLETEMASELQRLSRRAAAIASSSPDTCDFTQPLLQRAIAILIASFPVYRTYRDHASPMSDADRKAVEWAFGLARRRSVRMDQSVFNFLHDLLIGNSAIADRPCTVRLEILDFVLDLQQYTGPVIAKGVEDTAFYRYTKLLACNEVGSDPSAPPLSATALHVDFSVRAERAPHAMLTTSTHDTKRDEDARARLCALSEYAEDWSKAVRSWRAIIRARLGDIERQAPPSANDEYMLFQLMVSTWPVELLDGPVDACLLADYRNRLEECMIKSIRESKTVTSWINPHAEYETAVLNYVRTCLAVDQPPAFFERFIPFVQQIAEAGAKNSVLQTVLKLTALGVPDCFQGSELWDLSFVDPDNRRRVDYELRDRLVRSPVAPAHAFQDWRSGLFKIQLYRRLLGLRARQPDLFEHGSYEPLIADGNHFGFTRRLNEASMTVWLRHRSRPTSDSQMVLPLQASNERDILSDRSATTNQISSAWLEHFPAAVFVNEAEQSSS